MSKPCWNNNMRKNLIIFIDAFPFGSLEGTAFLATLPSRAKIRPGFGYSVNVKAELFGGLKPDAAGYLCEWTYDPDSALRKLQPLFTALRLFSHPYLLDRVVHKIVSKILRQNVFNIPFDRLGHYRKTGCAAYEQTFDKPTLFTEVDGIRMVRYSKYRTDRDNSVFDEAHRVLEAENDYSHIFLSLADLDALMHRQGMNSAAFREKIQALDQQVEKLWSQFRKKHRDAGLIVLSDHGMAPVTDTVSVKLENKFGPSRPDTYMYFIDATILRAWSRDSNLTNSIEQYLTELGHGQVLSQEERKRYGISSARFGDLIFLLDEGVVFIPSFFGKRFPLAMHGYRSELESQAGMLVSSESLTADEFTSTRVFEELRRIVTQELQVGTYA